MERCQANAQTMPHLSENHKTHRMLSDVSRANVSFIPQIKWKINGAAFKRR